MPDVKSNSALQIVAIGGSAGSIDVLHRTLPLLPESFSFALVIVLHIPAQQKSILPISLSSRVLCPVKEAEDKEMIQPGWIYFAPPNYHLLVEPHGYFALNSDEPVHYSRPSIDVTFESIAFSYEERAAGIILSGANEDGAWGLKQIAQRGGSTAVQTPESAIAPVMPQAAIEQVPGSRVLSVDAIYPYLVELSLRN